MERALIMVTAPEVQADFEVEETPGVEEEVAVEVAQELYASPGLQTPPTFRALPGFLPYSLLTPRLRYPNLPLLCRGSL
jgi:hypothetical protein